MPTLHLFLIFLSLSMTATSSAHSARTEPLQRLVETSAKRLLLARRVALAKWDSGAGVEDAAREERILQAVVKNGNALGLDSAQVGDFFRAQFEAGKLIQYSLLAEWRREGKAPPHTGVDLVNAIRPQLDDIDRQLNEELSATLEKRSHKTCRFDVAMAVGNYLDAHRLRAGSLEAIALDRAMAAACAR